MIKQNEIKILLMANVHGGNLPHPDTEAIKLSKAGALEPIFIIIFLNASSAQWTSQQL
jgi:hypothetical protein